MPALDALSQIDCSVIMMIGRGDTNSEIADQVHYSVPWVKRHIGVLMKHFNVRNRTELAIIANGVANRSHTIEGYRVTHMGSIVPVVAVAHGAQFQVATSQQMVTVKVRIEPGLAITAGLDQNYNGALLLRLTLIRRLRSYLQQGIDMEASFHEIIIESREELAPLLEPAYCDFRDERSSRCRAASVSDPSGGAIDSDSTVRSLTNCNVPPPEIRCHNLSSVTVQAAVAPGGIEVGRHAAAARCLAGEPLDIGRVGDCVAGGRECWTIAVDGPTSTQPD